MFYRFMYLIEKVSRKMYIEGTLMSKSRNIAVTLQMRTFTDKSDERHTSNVQSKSITVVRSQYRSLREIWFITN